jgi:Fusaric acid resistance protein-like
VLVLAVDVSLGVVFALGTLPVAMAGVPPRRKARPRLMVVGLLFGAAYALGCVIGEWPAVAVVSIVLLAAAAATLAARKPAGRVVTALALPAFALGMNEPVPQGLLLAALFVAGCSWAALVAYCWPESAPPSGVPSAPEPAPGTNARAVRVYAIGLAAAAGIGLALGFLLDLRHVAWAAAAALFIMRPQPEMLVTRAWGRVLATFAGVLGAAVVYQRGLAEIGLAVIAVAAITAMVATRSSRWYVAPAGSGLVVLLVSGVSSTKDFEVTLDDRLIGTAIGAALALTFGIALPRLVAARARRRAPAGTAP